VHQAPNLLIDLGDRAARFWFLIRDRAWQFTGPFDEVQPHAGIEVINQDPAAKPNGEQPGLR
jgi:hypothetical protein